MSEALVPLSALTGLATLARKMLQAQRNYFDARKSQPHVVHTVLFEEARSAERRLASAAADALARERQRLPGFEPEAGSPADVLRQLKRVCRYLGQHAERNHLSAKMAAKLRDEAEAVIRLAEPPGAVGREVSG